MLFLLISTPVLRSALKSKSGFMKSSFSFQVYNIIKINNMVIKALIVTVLEVKCQGALVGKSILHTCSPLQKHERTAKSLLYWLDWKSKHLNWNVAEWKATQPGLRVFSRKLFRWEPCKSCNIPYKSLGLGQTESQLDASWKLGSTYDSFWPGLACTCVDLTWLAWLALTLVGFKFTRKSK